MDHLWQRVLKGQPTALLGLSPGEPPAALNLARIRVSCDGPPTTLGPLLDARRKAELILDVTTPLLDQARQRLVLGLRRQLLGDVPTLVEESGLVELWNRLAQEAPRPYAIIFDAVDAADEPTLDVLRRILSRPGWLKLPLILVFRKTEPSGAAGALLGTLRATAGPEAVVAAEAPRPPAPPPEASSAAPSAPAPTPASPAPAEVPLRALPPDVLRILRVGAVLGSGFEVELVATLLGEDPLSVLDAIQRAADAGVPLEDRGEGRIYLPASVIDALRASTLPSLSLLLHRRIAALLTEPGMPEERFAKAPPPEREPASAAPEAVAAPVAAAAPPPPEPSFPASSADAEAAAESAAPLGDPAEKRSGPWPYTEIFAGAAVEPSEGGPAPAPPAPEASASPPSAAASASRADVAGPRARPPSAMPHVDDARAAGHLAAAGEIELSAERYLAAAQQAAAMGATAQAMSHGKKALQLLSDLPDSRKRRLLRIAVILEFGRLQWQAAGPGNAEPEAISDGVAGAEPGSASEASDATFTLAGALSVLESAAAALQPGDPLELITAASCLIAGVCYDLGDLRALERALAQLSRATRLLLDAGDATGAARLLNDQAAVYIRMGDPVRAAHLLGESRKVFEARAEEDPVAMIEMAETDHLFARIPLHVAARPGREQDALSMGLDHALAAERTYRRLGDDREVARVWETMGRLELRKGRLDRAAKRLSAAADAQAQLGDLVGLARSTAALSEVLATGGRYRDALSLLGDSVTFNVEKGSPLGIAFNRRAFDALAPIAAADAGAGPFIAEVSERLRVAESVFGRMRLPGEGEGERDDGGSGGGETSSGSGWSPAGSMRAW